MQRRGAAIYVAFFLVIAAGSYSLIGAAEAPEISFENSEYELAKGDEFTVEDRTYTLEEITTEEDGDREATAAWVEEDVEQQESWADGDSIEYQTASYVVTIPDGDDPAEFELREELDDDVETVERDDGVYVVVESDGEERLVHVDDYEGLERHQFAEGDDLEYDNQTVTVGDVSSEAVTVTWTEDVEETQAISEGEVTLNDQTYYALFADGNALQLSTDQGSYESQVQKIEQYDDRINGLWGITILSLLAVVFVTSMAYMPVRE